MVDSAITESDLGVVNISDASNEDAFILWLQNRGIAESVIESSIINIYDISNYALLTSKSKETIFKIFALNDIQELNSKLFSDPVFINKNREKNNKYLLIMNKYLKFLKHNEAIEALIEKEYKIVMEEQNNVEKAKSFFLNQPQRDVNLNLGIRNYALYLFACNCTLRMTTILSLKVENITDISNTGDISIRKSFVIQEGQTKKKLEVPIKSAVQEALIIYLKARLLDLNGVNLQTFLKEPLFKSRNGSEAMSRSQAWNIIQHNKPLPYVKNKKRSDTNKKPHCTYKLTDIDDMELAEKWFDNQPQRYANQHSNIRNYALFIFACNCARRISDILAFKVSDVVSLNGEIKKKLILQERKTDKYAEVFINPSVSTALSKYLAIRAGCELGDKQFLAILNEPLFASRDGGSIQRCRAWQIMTDMRKACEISQYEAESIYSKSDSQDIKRTAIQHEKSHFVCGTLKTTEQVLVTADTPITTDESATMVKLIENYDSARFSQPYIRSAFKEWLSQQYPDWSPNTLIMHCSDAFYLLNNHRGVTLGDALCDDSGIQKAYDAIERHFALNPTQTSTSTTSARGYIRTLLMFKQFLQERFPGLLSGDNDLFATKSINENNSNFSDIIDFEDGRDGIHDILSTHFQSLYGYSNINILWDAAQNLLPMFLNDNAINSTKDLWKFVSRAFYNEYILCAPHIWQTLPTYPQNVRGLVINLARQNDGVVSREQIDAFFALVKINAPINSVLLACDELYFYNNRKFIPDENVNLNAKRCNDISKALKNLFSHESIPFILLRDIKSEWFSCLPELSAVTSWTPLLLQEVLRVRPNIGYRTETPIIKGQDYDTLRAAILPNNSDITTFADIVHRYCYDKYKLPLRMAAEDLRLELRNAGFLEGNELIWNMHKGLKDYRFAFTDENKMVMILER